MAGKAGPRKWRLERQNRKAGSYFVLVTGSREAKKSIGLGYVPEADAELACQRLNEDEHRTHGTPREGRVLRLYEESGLAPLLGFLTDRTLESLDGVLPEAPPDYRHWPLERYAREVYEPWRREDRPKTWRTEEHDWTYILAPGGLGNVPLDKVDAHRVDAFLEHLQRKRGGPASPNAKRRCRSAIHACITYAYRKKHRSQPVPEWFRLRGTSQSRPLTDKTLTKEEVLALVQHAVGWEPEADGKKPRNASWANAKAKWQALFSVLFGLPLRPSEAASLRWQDIRIDAREVDVAVQENARKTEASRATLPLFPLPLRYLKAWWEMRGRPSEGLVFPAPGTGPEKPYIIKGSTGFSKSLKASVKAAGITKPVTAYWGRHTAATLAFAGGASPEEVAKLLRHTSPAMMRKHYDHTSASQLKGLERFGKLFE